ncbi:MAG: hypothetical protein LGB71_03095 [Sulfurovum sp.]|nr:hypothetical protein [Sulfurovum sp.]
MGNKIVKIEDTLITIGGYILQILKDKKMSIDEIYLKLREIYPKKDISFEIFIYAIDFLYMIDKLDLSQDDIVEIKL